MPHEKQQAQATQQQQQRAPEQDAPRQPYRSESTRRFAAMLQRQMPETD
jgi:hypothetical protein